MPLLPAARMCNPGRGGVEGSTSLSLFCDAPELRQARTALSARRSLLSQALRSRASAPGAGQLLSGLLPPS